MISTLPLRVQAPRGGRERTEGPHPQGMRALRREAPRRWPNAPGCSAGQSDHVRLRPLLTLRDLELDSLAFLQGAVSVHLYRAVVDEDIRTTVDRDEAVALLRVEPLDGALSHS